MLRSYPRRSRSTRSSSPLVERPAPRTTNRGNTQAMWRKSVGLAKQFVSMLGYSESFGQSLPIFVTDNGKTCNRTCRGHYNSQAAVPASTEKRDSAGGSEQPIPSKVFCAGDESRANGTKSLWVETAKASPRLARQLVRLLKQIGRKRNGEIELNVPHELLAEVTAMTQFTVSRLLSEWQAQGVVRVRRGAITIRSYSVLKCLFQESRDSAA